MFQKYRLQKHSFQKFGFQKIVAAVLAVTVGLAGLVTIAPEAEAWKPYTHVDSAESAYFDAIADGQITINGRNYPVDPRVVTALRNHPAHYNAGVVGPDAFPDLAMGQSVIHPNDSGAWMTWVLEKAWGAQNQNYTATEKQQILAFAYGFVTHAAGDVWAHTFVNQFAEGIFPGIGDLVSQPTQAAIALRHVVVEAYVGDATPGFDGNPNRTVISASQNDHNRTTVSDDSTPDIDFAAPPDNFIWETFIERPKSGRHYVNQPMPGQPSGDRGVVIDAFYALHNQLIDYGAPNYPSTSDAVACVVGMASSFPPVQAAAYLGPCDKKSPLTQVRRAYAGRWAADVEEGLQKWGEIGMSFAVMFDPGARRAAQDHECREMGSDYSSVARRNCEDAIGIIDTGTWYADQNNLWTTNGPELASMLGAPEWVLGSYAELERFFGRLDRIINIPNPLREPVARAKEGLKQYLKDGVSEALGFDVDVFQQALREPATLLNNGGNLPPQFRPPGGLFVADALPDMDALMGLGPNDHLANGRLADNASYDEDTFAVVKNTITMSKLALLNGSALNALLTNEVGRPIRTYRDRPGQPDNIMVRGLNGRNWLESLDSNHQWRTNGLPIGDEGGGSGQMPIWESCVMRPAFRSLFTDWQNGNQNFPDLGDRVSPDPLNDPAGPWVRATKVGDRSWQVVAYERSGFAFGHEDFELRYRFDDGPWQTTDHNSVIAFGGPDGVHKLHLEAGDPCHTLNPDDNLPTAGVQTIGFVTDASASESPPTLTNVEPRTVSGAPALLVRWLDQTGASMNVYRDGDYYRTLHPGDYDIGGRHAYFFDTNVVPGQTYEYHLVAFQKGQNDYSDRSNTMSGTAGGGDPEPPTDPPPTDPPPTDPPTDPPPSDNQAPTTPGNVRALRYSSTAGEVQWDRSSDPDGQVVGYRIVRNGTDLGVRDALSIYEGSLTSGTYVYEITAIDDEGKASPIARVTLQI